MPLYLFRLGKTDVQGDHTVSYCAVFYTVYEVLVYGKNKLEPMKQQKENFLGKKYDIL